MDNYKLFQALMLTRRVGILYPGRKCYICDVDGQDAARQLPVIADSQICARDDLS